MIQQNDSQDLFVFNLLARVAAIQRTIQVTTPDDTVLSVKYAYPRWWQPIGNDGFPGFYNKAVRTGSTSQGVPIYTDVYRVTMRLAIGPAFAGYQGEYEDMGNMLYNATISRFRREQRLADPTVGQPQPPLQYVVGIKIVDADSGIEGKDYGGTPQTVYICLDIPMDVQANFQVYRNS